MNIFRKRLKREHIEQFDKDLSKILESEFPLYKETLALSKFDGFGITKNPKAITLARNFDSEIHKKNKHKFIRNFDLNGVSIWNRKTKKYEPIELRFHFESLSQIIIEDPNNFRDNFDLKKILTKNINVTEIKNIA